MSDEVRDSIGESAREFKRLVWPHFKDIIGGVKLYPVETSDSDADRSLDSRAGIDAWCLKSDGGTRGIASRIQWPTPQQLSDSRGRMPSWMRTFTIRWALSSGGTTEALKRLSAIRDDDTFPQITVQGYATRPRCRGVLLDAGHVNTRDLYTCLGPRMEVHEAEYGGETGPKYNVDGVYLQENPEDGNLFCVVPWRLLGVESFADRGLLPGSQLSLDIPPAPLGNTMRSPGNTFASVATYKLTEEGHAKDDVRAAVVAMKGDGPDPLLTPDEVDELRAALGAEPLGDYVPPQYPPAWLPAKDYGRWNEHWGTDLPTPLPRRTPRTLLP